ncbi:fasciclin domain-containing protein [Luteimonas weifangensis]|uniref:Fasciclin domain-containing protein n=2 Tax=Cognatiluteimonas weifangensis TaxID=2303539 RepID=A0A372DIU4_9GAMM|nr:fasciclin domain-containing protein [Luteimonas weifangensis]
MHSTSSTSTSAPSSATRNIVDTAAANGSFKIFSNALRQSGLANTLKGNGPFTVLAPTDAAFGKLPPGQLDTWLKPENKDELAAVMNYHVLAGRSSAAEIGKLTAVKTINGQSAPIVMSGSRVRIGDAELTTPDIASSNGVLHGIDKVNIPTRH